MIEFRPLLELNFNEIGDLFTRCFEGYLITLTITGPSAAAHSRRDGIDHARSFVAMWKGEPVGIALVAPRFDIGRLAGMGIVKEARGQGVGRAVVAEFISRLRKDGFREAVLEVFEQNEPAVRLYRSFGFASAQRLYGFERKPIALKRVVALKECSVGDYIEALSGTDVPHLQSAGQLALTTLPARCWTVDGQAFALFAPPSPGQPISPSGFIVAAQSRGLGKGRELFEAIQSAYPQAPWMLRQVFPESVSGFLERLGFSRLELNQFEMRLPLLSGPDR